MSKRIEHLAEGVTLHLGDCREILPTLGNVDAVATDPPYGVGYSYQSYDDSPDKHAERCSGWVQAMKSACDGPIAVACGIKNMWEWPQPHWVISWRKTFSVSRSPFGSGNWEPILVYNKGKRGERSSDSFEATYMPDALASEHPCPKPITYAKQLLLIISLRGELILDPFMGSGTTGAAAVKLGRKFIGIEIEPKYFDIACRRISESLKQPDLFIESPAKVEQGTFL